MNQWKDWLRAEAVLAPYRMKIAGCRIALLTGLVEVVSVESVGVEGMAIKVRVKPPLLGKRLGFDAAIYAAGFTAARVVPGWADRPMCVDLEQVFVNKDIVVVNVSFKHFEGSDDLLTYMLCMN